MKTLILAGTCLLSLSACADLPTLSAATAAATATVSQAQTDVQNAINLYGVAKGIAQVASLAMPQIAPIIAAVTLVADPDIAKAQQALNDASVDATALEQLATSISAQANALTLKGAPAVTVVPNAAPAATGTTS